MKYIIEDSYGNHCFKDEVFNDFEDGWEWLCNKYPVIYNADVTQWDSEDKCGEYYYIQLSK